ncbi:ribosomal protein L5 [Chlamydia pneumoniae TW-183]|uniref:Large ribosomal subunit protein uL5 n=2 Tax=Chlamydia pneumoniae TaxID=83558 RepID=RL5_CHLPN|nr:50S ribosomal protein L5 [Chlamydia pneumoniae]Q9Z7R9.1 RecName: Full=Large ribosomal subunit protein uL5; AltName: Full=50S ribosomal protein L5 [Chlamydia pneumoniae]AAD18774.1 L5 Ribosomal Protein [Chlamydia pneumoniae CWL029]AAF37995.1 ribosomal protein L5 [Chlamydia pneumoniae AR39]AAP98590.1 ribosomal protein L5 [Chlamydia pneumoniae TW-183]ACZ32519.1 ribosomal protein L5 [Chlamydia pneumoniae LPCoLN]ETR80539.1 LSU ribosomal protein L5p (L11e) [Chlamydia pneumoniae B21]
MSRLKKFYTEEIRKSLFEKFGYANKMQIPVLKKIVLSMGLAEAAKDKNLFQAHLEELTMISGQKPLVTKARNSIAGFKLREGQGIGAKVTLRGIRMYDFMDRFCNIVSPRIRDFRGFSNKGDGRGCYSVGLDDQQIFPEINLDRVKRTQGLNITWVTTAQTDDECTTLLELMGLRFKKAQ